MAASGFTPISLYYSATASAVPVNTNLANGELALNTADMKLYAKNSSGVVTLLASNAATAAGVDSFSAGSTGFTPSTATTGAVTLAGTLNVANGGTGLTTLTASYVPYGNGTSAFASSANLTFSGSSLTVKTGYYEAYDPTNTTSAGVGMRFYTDGGGTKTENGRLSVTQNATGSSTSNMLFYTNNGTTLAEKMRLDGAGNLGLGVTPSGNFMLEAGSTASPAARSFKLMTLTGGFSGGNYPLFGYNFRSTATSGVYKYDANDFASAINFSGGMTFNIAASGTAGNNITFTEAMTLTAAGNLGVGTSSPSGKFHTAFNATGNQFAYFTNNQDANTGLSISTSTRTWWMFVGDSASNALRFYDSTAAAERARISSTGGFSVGTTADPGAGAIYATGNITAYYSSDIKFKENVRDIPDALATVNAIGGKLFDWKDDYIESKGGADGYFVQKADFGVVAQDVQKVFPIAVRTREDGSLAVDYEKLGALAFAAVSELTKRVEALEAK
jgi:hypothetical protein